MKTFMCELYDCLDSINDAFMTSQYDTVLDREWELIQSESIDYGILEKANNVYTIKADFQWNDLGSWHSLFNVLTKNNETNYHDGDVISVQSENNLIHNLYYYQFHYRFSLYFQELNDINNLE